MTQLVLFNVFNGLIIGAFYALMALGLSLILNLSGVINFAHGGFLAIGGYLAFQLIVGLSIPAFTFPGLAVWAVPLIPSFSFGGLKLLPGIGYWGALIVSPFLVAFIGIFVERVLIRQLYGRDPLYSLLLTFGLAFMIEDGTRFIWGAQSLPFQIPGWLSSPLSPEYFFLTGYRVFMILLVTATVAGLFFILNYTRLGIRIRAGTLDLETVSVLGVNVRLLRNLNFGLGIYLAGLAGVLAVGMLGLQPTIGDNLIMPSFIAIIVGGLGSLPGTLAGGILIGVVSGVTTVFLPSASEAVIYVMMAAVLIVRPRGLLGEEGRF
jgi:branched-chain amino acid transport system permease protein